MMSTDTSTRLVIAAASAVCGMVVVVLLNLIPMPYALGKFLVDKGDGVNVFALQNAMWIVFAIGIGELVIRVRHAKREAEELNRNYLPEDERTILTLEDLPEFYKKLRGLKQKTFLTRLIPRIILQFQSSRSIEQSTTMLNSSLDLFLHEIDLRYNILKYINWLIPSLGFIGTVYGIVLTLDTAGGMEPDDANLLSFLTRDLSVAFYTTLLALLMSTLLMLLKHIAVGKEEAALNSSGQYCLDHLINRLYIPASKGAAK